MITLNDNLKRQLCDGIMYSSVAALGIGLMAVGVWMILEKKCDKENADNIASHFHISTLGYEVHCDWLEELDERVNNLENEIKALKESKESKEDSNK